MNRLVISLGILLIALAFSNPAFPMRRVYSPGVPMGQQPDWPAGLADLLNSAGRVYGYWVNANDWFFYAGDTDDFNEFLKRYSKLEDAPLTLVLHPGKGETGHLGDPQKKTEYDWELKVFHRGWHPEAPPDPTVTKQGYVIKVEVWLGGAPELDEISVPPNVKVKSAEENEKFTKFVADHDAKRAQPEEATQPPEHQDTSDKPSDSTESPQALAPATLKSSTPRYAKVTLNEDGSKVLSVMFDESQGTGTGYDVLYADVNFNGRFDNDERFEKAPPSRELRTGFVPLGWSSNTFQSIIVNVPYNAKGEGIPNPCEITFTCQRYQIFPGGGIIELSGELRDWDPVVIETGETTGVQVIRSTGEPVRVNLPSAATREEFSARCLIRLRQDSSLWEYSFEGKIQTSESLESASVWSFEAKPQLTVSSQPDGRNEGNLGVALELNAGDRQFECKKNGASPKAHVEVKKLDGTVVHEGDDDLGKFRFG